MTPVDPVALTADLVRCPSVTPNEGGALVLLEDVLTKGGFTCTRGDRGGISNLFARWGRQGANRSFGFNGHTDVVPLGDENAWTMAPFGAEIKDGYLYGRGATDMKSGVAAFAAAAIDFVSETPPDGAVILAITGDEEADAIDGTTALLDWMNANNEAMSVCLVGEPTSPNVMGEAMKIGRRGSMTAFFTITGVQGHSAYPHRAKNPMPAMARLMDALSSREVDQTRATVNIRFNEQHTSTDLTTWMQETADEIAAAFDVRIEMRVRVSGESFVTPPGYLSDFVASAVEAETGRNPRARSAKLRAARRTAAPAPNPDFEGLGLPGRDRTRLKEGLI
mgnify:CR=1 FL=1